MESARSIKPFSRVLATAPSLRQGLRSRWLHAALPRPLAEDHGPEKLTLKNIQLSVSGKSLLPDFAFSNAVPLDVTMPFHPFGETPKIGDAFYLSCSEALAKPNAKLTLSFECTATPQEREPAMGIFWHRWLDKIRLRPRPNGLFVEVWRSGPEIGLI